MNTSMTINATAAWLLALYIANADEQNVPRTSLQGTTQNDIIKDISRAAPMCFRRRLRCG
jgi:(2R)-ethylmalonyl-CoA mutase